MKKIKLPNLNGIDDYDKFYNKLLRNMNTKDKKINVTAVYITEQNDIKLAEHIKKSLRKKNRHFTDKWFNSAWSMHHLCYAPNTSNPDVENGYALIDTKKLFTL